MGKLDALMGKAFRSSKCKTMLKLTVARIKILSNKKELQCKQLRKDIAQLLQNNQEASARIRVEHFFREKNTLDAYLLIGGYCEAVSERIKFIKMQKTCPNDMKESIASLVFAAPRCADLPELQDVRSLFAAKYGKEFTESAVELRAGCGVNNQMIEKLSTKVPSSEVKLKLLKEIASEHGIKWNFEELKPTEVQDGSKQNFETTQATLKPQDVTPEPAKIPFMSSKAPDNVRQQDSGTKDKQDAKSFTEQGPEGLPRPDIYISNSLRDPLNIKMDSVASPISATDTNQNFMRFAKLDTVASGLKQENAKYKDVATAAQAAFESAAYAAVAARAACELAKSEVWNKIPNETVNDSREALSESEDVLGEALPRKKTDGKFRLSPGGGSGTEGTFSTRNDQAFDIKSPRKRNGANDVSHTASGFVETQYSGREVSDSENEDGLSEALLRNRTDGKFRASPGGGRGTEGTFSTRNDQAFDIISPRKRNGANDVSNTVSGFMGTQYSGKEVYDSESGEEPSEDQDGEKEFETDSLRKDGKLNNEQIHKGMNEPQMKRSMSASTSSSSKTSFSPKSSHPLFDDYSDGEDEKNPTARYSDQSMFTAKNSGTEDTHLGNTHYANNQRQLPRYDENDEYEKGITRKESKNQGFTHEASGPPKLSYGDLLEKEKYSLNHFKLHSENEMEILNDDNVKFQGQRNPAMINLHAPGNYQSPTAIPDTNKIGTVSADQSTYTGYMGNHDEYEPHSGNKKQYFNQQDSDDEGVYRYEGDGKLSWRPANIEEQHSSVASRKSRVNTRLSVRTRR